MFQNDSSNLSIFFLILFEEEVDSIVGDIKAYLPDILDDAWSLIVFKNKEVVCLVENKGNTIESVVFFDLPVGFLLLL